MAERAVAKTRTFDYSLLSVGERWMDKLIGKARHVSEALKVAGVPHAVIGGLAVASHVARRDEAATRNTRDLDLLVRAEDLARIAAVLKPLGFKYRKVLGIPAFIPAGGKFRDAVHLVWAGQRVRNEDVAAAPELTATGLTTSPYGFQCLDLPSLLRMKLTSYRLKDRVHVQDLLELGLIGKKIRAGLPEVLQQRLKEIEAETEQERLG